MGTGRRREKPWQQSPNGDGLMASSLRRMRDETVTAMNINRILCPTDFSDASAHAVDLAALIAGWYKARIAALHVVSSAVVLPELRLSPVSSVDEAALSALQSATAARFAEASGAGIAVDVFVETGSPATRILERANELPADLIVMGTHGTSGFQHLMLGSVTERVLRKAACPVVTVPPRAPATSRIPFKRLLCAIDFSESSMAALQFAVSIASESGGVLTMLHVLEWPWEEPPAPRLDDLPAEQGIALAEYRRYREKMATMQLEELASATRMSDAPLVRLRNGKPHVQILDVAQEESSDLIVIGVHGRNPLDMMIFGSTANHVIRAAACPVLTVRR
jgi:nucleotide-binding universal stress UspA family protein